MDAGVCLEGDCEITHKVIAGRIEIEFGHAAGSLTLCLSEDAAVNLMNVVTAATEEFQRRAA